MRINNTFSLHLFFEKESLYIIYYVIHLFAPKNKISYIINDFS